MNGHTSQTNLDTDGTTNTFKSMLAENIFGAPTEYDGLQFHFHAGSEHTIDGKRHDLEMHTVHQAKVAQNDFGYAAVGIMFSVSEYTAQVSKSERNIIDAFFDGLKWND